MKKINKKSINKKTEAKKVSKFIYWAPRILSMIFILFLMLFSLDVFGQGYGFWGTLLAFLMHNIPAFILAIVLIISWKYEIVGGVAFILAGLFYIVMLLTSRNFEWYMMFWSVTISGPTFFIGILFLINWRRK
ncbi:MAG: DUF7670 domain-containing protein [Candidatus Woesearchaeota archaeon]